MNSAPPLLRLPGKASVRANARSIGDPVAVPARFDAQPAFYSPKAAPLGDRPGMHGEAAPDAWRHTPRATQTADGRLRRAALRGAAAA